LRTKFVGAVGLLLVVIAVFLMLFFPSRMEQIAQAGLENRAKSVAILAAGAAIPVFDAGDALSLQPLLASLAKTSDLEYLALRRADGSVLAGINQQEVPEPIATSTEPTTRIEKGLLRADILVVPRSGKPGTLTIGFKLDQLDQERREQVRVVAGLSLLVLVAGLLISFSIGTLVLRPIKALTELAREVARTGDLNQKVLGVTSHDEVGTLAETFQEMMQKLQVVPMTVRELTATVVDLTQLINDHTESTQQQASGLAEATVTMQEIRQTSSTASSKAETVIAIAKKAEEFSGAGQAAVENSLHSLQEIRTQIEQIVAKIADLSERTLQVGGIIETVKDLADQSNMLALNASIEAVKAGELGKGFGVVAREIRTLADGSIQATGRIREVLTEIQRAIRSTAAMTEQGKRDMERSMDQIRASGESLREMNAVVTESSQAARQIAASVNQQNVGISQITGAIEGLNSAMEKTSSGIRRAEAAAAKLTDLSARVSSILAGSLH
jgi:methyl-accepting chemotaxis protein